MCFAARSISRAAHKMLPLVAVVREHKRGTCPGASETHLMSFRANATRRLDITCIKILLYRR
eukprot:3880330-Pleurochrysis_carterae.AAC.1